jgi:predicted flap endonuclease-1-like 5' DNA nuclease
MKRIAKVIGLVGGIVAVVWAMRDRFISVATSREPVPPTFKEPEAGRPVDSIDGIGPVFARRLTEAGIDSVSRLAGATPDRVAESASVSVARAKTWIETARQQTAQPDST